MKITISNYPDGFDLGREAPEAAQEPLLFLGMSWVSHPAMIIDAEKLES
jgi:hypothetical protein